MATTAEIDDCLPQTQCTRCGYPSCLDYAEAIQRNDAAINRCPPGGDVTISLLAAATRTAVLPLASDLAPTPPPRIARVRESDCIGCTLCIQICPVDAIIGAGKFMHTILEDDCTGCELCLPACPMDCIDLEPDNRTKKHGAFWEEFDGRRVTDARRRARARRIRLATDQTPRKRADALNDENPDKLRQLRQDEIRAAVARVRQKRATRDRTTPGRVAVNLTVK